MGSRGSLRLGGPLESQVRGPWGGESGVSQDRRPWGGESGVSQVRGPWGGESGVSG